MKQKILDYTRNNKHIVLWAVISLSVVFLFTFFVYINNHARDGIYPEDQFGTLKEFKKHLNPYINIYNIKQEKNSNNESQNNSVQTGFGFMATDNPERRSYCC